MAFKKECHKNAIAIQVSHNQLLVNQLDNLNDDKTITFDTSIENFVINLDEDLICVQLANRQFEFYRLATTSKVLPNVEIEYRDYKIFFVCLEALWMGDIADNLELTFNVFTIRENRSSKVSVNLEVGNQIGNPLIIDYCAKLNNLIFTVSLNKIFILFHYRILRLNELKLINKFQIDEKPAVKSVFNSDSSLILFVTKTNQINIIDGTKITNYQMTGNCQIKTIFFDSVRLLDFCVQTTNIIYFMHYIPEKGQIVSYHLARVQSNVFPITSKIPHIFTLFNNVVSENKLKELSCFEANEATILDMLSAEYDLFLESLYNSRFTDKAMWSIVVKRCIKQRDIHAGIYCVAKLGDAGFVRTLKQEMAQAGHIMACSLLALNFDMADEAEEILRSSNCANQLSKLFQLQNKWHDVFEHADKIRIKSFYYDYARQLENENKVIDAIKYYELSGNVLQIPRMLFEIGNIDQLEQYCLNTNGNKPNNTLVTWIGQYCESQGDNKTAIEMYQKADDHYNLVRLMCHIGQIDNATQIVNRHLEQQQADPEQNSKTGSSMTAAILYLGKHLETTNPNESIKYYLECGAILHAIRVCTTNDLYDKLATIAIEHCSVNEARNILEIYLKTNDSGFLDEQNLLKLYYKCDYLGEAIRFAMKNHLWDLLRTICDNELDKEKRDFVVDNQVISLALDSLKNNTSIIDIVIDLIIMSDQENFALITQIVQSYNINLDNHLMDKLEKFAVNQNSDTLIDTFAELCLERGNYQLAAKLYNKIGKRDESVKALIRLGNVDKVIQFANVARDKTVFKMAANFLQTINYQETSLILKFYTKADAKQELQRYKETLQSLNDDQNV